MLLPRHNRRGIAVVDEGRGQVQKIHVDDSLDPLSSSFVLPDWLLEKPTPWTLVGYFESQLANVATDKQERKSYNGFKAELRPAKTLIETYGIELAARMAAYWAQKFSCNVTLHYAVKHAEEFLQLCHQ